MTYPTERQIEAAAKALCAYEEECSTGMGWDDYTEVSLNTYRRMAKAALLAANAIEENGK